MIVNVGPAVSQQLTVTLYESTRLECQAEGNPPPRYQWLHRRHKDGEEDIVIRSEDRYLHITNVTYEHQGEYICIATSTINGLERMVQSEAITLRVVGKDIIVVVVFFFLANGNNLGLVQPFTREFLTP